MASLRVDNPVNGKEPERLKRGIVFGALRQGKKKNHGESRKGMAGMRLGTISTELSREDDWRPIILLWRRKEERRPKRLKIAV